MHDASQSEELYTTFYEEVGKRYPETALVHAYRSAGTRYWTVLRELRPFAQQAKRLLDVGCNDGVYSIPYSQMGGLAVGIDISSALVQKATVAALAAGVQATFFQSNIETTINIEGAPFDVVLCSEVLEHLRKPYQAIQHMCELLRPGGHLILTCPTPLMEISPLSGRYVAVLVAGQRLVEKQLIHSSNNPLADYGVGGFLYRHDGYYPSALRRYIERYGFRCIRYYTISFPVPRLISRTVRSMWQILTKHTYDTDSSNRHGGGLSQPSFPHRIRWGLDLLMRYVPGLNLLGSTNIQIFYRL